MFKRNPFILMVCLIFGVILCAPAYTHADDVRAKSADEALPDSLKGSFVQRKTLADVEITITSKGRFEFEKGKFFKWHTLDPLESVFIATPTNYSMIVNGKTTTQNLKNDVTSVAKIFEIKEVKDFVKCVKSVPEVGFPERLTVEFKNGDKLEIDFHR